MTARVKTLTVEKLKILLRTEGLPVSGVKNELQLKAIARKATGQFGLVLFPFIFTSDTANLPRYREAAQCR